MDTPQDLRDLVLGPEVGGEVDDELSRRRHEHVMDSVSGDEVWSSWRKASSGRCVMVHLNAERRVESIANAPDGDYRR